MLDIRRNNITRLWILGFILLVVFGGLTGCFDDSVSIIVEPNKNLSSEDLEVQKKFTDYLQESPSEAIKEYRQPFEVINTGNAP